MTLTSFILRTSVTLGVEYTEEQMDFASDFLHSVICFADPGTGKTATAVLGLLITELYHKIPGNNIYALSFTQLATSELAVRHERACKQLGISQHVNFKTLHAMCTAILKKNYYRLGMDSFKVVNSFSVESLAQLLLGTAEEWNIKLNPYKVRSVVHAIRSLNSSLIFEEEHVKSTMAFKECQMDFNDFTRLRKMAYSYSKLTNTVQVDDILLYTLELLTRAPEVSEEFKSECKIMLVDEAQDLSLLQLRLVSLLTQTAVLIGDLKQQIYAFNGACQEIVEQFFKFYPDAGQKYLTQSFRCSNEIARYAKGLIRFNKVGGENFRGVGDGGFVLIEHGVDLPTLCDGIRNDYVENNQTFPKSILFLFRNNYSAIPIIEELYKRRVPFRSNRYTGAHTIPVIKELCAVIELALNPTTYSNAHALKYLIPEMKAYKRTEDIPIVKVAKKQGVSILEINYIFKNDFVGNTAMNLLMELGEDLRNKVKLGKLFNKIWPLFYDSYLKDREPYLEYKVNYYTDLVAPLATNKTYTQFIRDELDKIEFMKDCEDRRYGVRCYTCHAAKGLEADVVHIIDANENIIPNVGKINKMIKKNCQLDAARELRNERSLVYVAATRAKKELHVYYDEEMGISPLLIGVNPYEELDRIYEATDTVYNDVESFTEFYA